MGGTTEPIINALKESYTENADLADALRIAVNALRANSSDNATNSQPSLSEATLEVAILDANRPRRAFRRINRTALESLLQETDATDASDTAAAEGSEAPPEPESDSSE